MSSVHGSAGQRIEADRERDFLRKVADATPTLLVVVDESATVAGNSVNKGFERAIGWTEDEMLGRSLLDILPREEHELAERGIAAAFGGAEPVEHVSRWLTRDGEERVIVWTATPIVDLSGRELALISGVDITERERQQEEIRASRARIVQAADDARRVIERNLHDGAQQSLVTLALTLRLAQTRLESDPAEASRLLESSRADLAHALEELRELARGIHPAILTERGLTAALESLAARSTIPVDVRGLAEPLPGPVEAAAYYLVSEALTNVAKYSGATSATVEIRRDGDRALVEITDDGVGGADAAGGSGLRGLADRIASLDGVFEVASRPGEGTRIRAEIPVV